MFEFFEHTADVGLRVRAKDLPDLLAEAGRGLFALIVENAGEIRADRRLDFQLRSDTPENLLFDWLDELLYTFEVRRLVLGRFDVAVNGLELTAAAFGEPLDPARHVLHFEVKAVTYHGLKIEQGEELQAEVIFDI